MATEKAKTRLASTTTAERTAFKAGDPVEYDGKLAKVVNFGYLEIPANPGEDIKFTDELVANLQLPALSPGGAPEYAFHVPASEIKKPEPKRLRALQIEFNALFGDPVPQEPAKDQPAPQIRQKGAAPEAARTSSTRGKKAEAAGERAPVDVVRAMGGKSTTVKTTDGESAKPKSKRSASKKAAK